mmetsp:Transcript_33614/g.72882  ORF Transcript_33614/g.72882 Transcript_33614/m.72882 type:complete len:98 (-) Transcript_33614:850-1143(-)
MFFVLFCAKTCRARPTANEDGGAITGLGVFCSGREEERLAFARSQQNQSNKRLEANRQDTPRSYGSAEMKSLDIAVHPMMPPCARIISIAACLNSGK